MAGSRSLVAGGAAGGGTPADCSGRGGRVMQPVNNRKQPQTTANNRKQPPAAVGFHEFTAGWWAEGAGR